LALDAFLEGDLLEVALPVVTPGVIDAGECLGVAAALQRDQGAAMRATVLERVEFTVGIPDDDHRGVADEGRDEIAGVLHLDGKTKIIPGRALEDPLLLGGVDVAVLKNPVGDARDAVVRPGVGVAAAGRASDLIQHETSRGNARGVDGGAAAPCRRLLVLPDRIELSTSPLPRECSTTELRQRMSRDKQESRKKPLQAAGSCHKPPLCASTHASG